MKTTLPLSALRHHVTGAIERGEKTAIVGIPANHACLNERTEADLIRCYLDWFNNYLSTDCFAEAYGIKQYEAVLVITAGRDAHERAVAEHAKNYAMALTGYAAEQGGAS